MADHDGAHKCSFTVRIDASLEDDAFHAPSFRFRFLDGTKKQTPTIGAVGWTAVPDTPGCWRFEAAIADVLVTEALASSIDEDPIVAFVLTDAGTAAAKPASDAKARPATGVAPPQAADSHVPSKGASATTGRGRLIADLFEVDTSVLLAGEDCLYIDHTWTSASSDVHIVNYSAGVGDEDDDDGPSVFARAAPSSSSAVPHASRSLFAPASGIRCVSIHIGVDKPLLSPGLRAKLNPLTITLATARRLPGIGSLRAGDHTATPHSVLAKRCRPVYAQWQFFPDSQLYTPAIRTRLVISHGRAHGDTATWQQATTLLAGRCHPHELYAALESASLSVELHDRDLLQTDDAALHKLHAKWESLHATGIDPTAAVPTAQATPRAAAPPPAKPLDAFAVDEVAKHDWRSLVARAGEQFAYGAATFRLHELLDKARVLTDATHSPYMRLKLTADVLARKRRAQPIDAAALAADSDTIDAVLSPLDRQTREPGAYVASSTTLSLHVTLQHPLTAASTTPPPLFSRLVVLFPYKDSRTLRQVMRVVESVNLKALPAAGASIRSYQLTESEKKACVDGLLDVVTGCMVIDDELRTVVVEGLARGGMAQLHAALPRSPSLRLLANDSLRFTRRLYTAFDVDLKRIKLRCSLPALLAQPDMYMRTKVAAPCYVALTQLMELRRVATLADARDLELLPTAATLLEVESKYGESISLEDIYGRRSVASTPTQGTKDGPATDVEEEGGAEGEDEDGGGERAEGARSTSKRTHLKAPTDATNAAFDQHLRTRESRDYLETRRKLSQEQRAAYDQQKQREEEEEQRSGSSSGVVYMYSGQKLRTQDALQEALRKTLSGDTRATYTYGAEFQSLAMSLVNPDELRQTEEREAKKKWTTQRGFVYPVPRATAEYYKHPAAPSAARSEDLRLPFVDNANHPKPVSRDNNRGAGPEFSTLPSKDMVFGGTNGDGSVNHEYFKSVHLCGEGLRQEMAEALERERRDWESKLVVDKRQLKFLAHGNICSQPASHHHAPPSQLDKLRDILNGPAKSKPLRIVRHATLPSGKLVPLQPPPASILTLQQYDGPVAAAFAHTLRRNDRGTPLLGTDPATGKPRDFHFPSVTDLITPPVKKHTTYTEIRPVASHEKKGFLWGNTAAQ